LAQSSELQQMCSVWAGTGEIHAAAIVKVRNISKTRTILHICELPKIENLTKLVPRNTTFRAREPGLTPYKRGYR
jgi:hypothetical protein